jgi:putative ABC transport system ATP-binding protein
MRVVPIAVTSEIVLEGVSKRFADGPECVEALVDVSCEIAAGEIVALMGPSGAGKTTLLNLIGGLDVPSAGRIWLAGSEVSSLSEDARADLRLRRVGVVFQAFNLLPGLTVAENIAWPLRHLGGGRREVRLRVAALLDELAVPPSACRRLPAELSGGQQQRVALARALVTSPRVLLADEPTGSLDRKNADEVLAMLVALNRRHAVTIVLVTHNPVAARIASRRMVLRAGRVIASDRSREGRTCATF